MQPQGRGPVQPDSRTRRRRIVPVTAEERVRPYDDLSGLTQLDVAIVVPDNPHPHTWKRETDGAQGVGRAGAVDVVQLPRQSGRDGLGLPVKVEEAHPR